MQRRASGHIEVEVTHFVLALTLHYATFRKGYHVCDSNYANEIDLFNVKIMTKWNHRATRYNTKHKKYNNEAYANQYKLINHEYK
ncbi:Hypothetical predicted protein [Octopus vulgaris]|uniref:Uncharacterized protein n=1 Tax=Octopus vulgaris TaxID=6645 RepID=A0AA36AWL7_OCTVU|nr:Hypothetical predicted protein [Octopus vulgaris]